jgi:hypothetical protein
MNPIAKSIWQNMSDLLLVKSDMKQDALSILLSNFALVYVIRRVKVNQDCFKLNGAHQLVVYADVYVWGRSIHAIKQNRSLVVSSK